MKRIIKISAAVIVLLAAVLFGIFLYLYKFYLIPAETGRITDNIYALKTTMVNLYIFSDGDNYIVFDAGLNEQEVKAEMKRINIDPDRVGYVFLTHSDSDHVGGVSAFKNARVYISKAEEPFITGKKLRTSIIGSHYNQLNAKYTTFNDREIFRIGKIKITALINPGHTDGSASFIVNDSILFVGDILIVKDGNAAPLDLFNMDTPVAEKSIKMLKEMSGEIKILCTAHSGCIRDVKKAFEKY